MFEDFGSKYVKLNTLFREIVDESRNIFVESNFFIDKSKLIYDDTKNIFENIRCLRMAGRGGATDDDSWRLGIGSMKIDAVLVDDLAIESLSFDGRTNSTCISHSFNEMTVFGTMDFGHSALKKYPFALTYANGTLNATRADRFPHYRIAMNSKHVTEPVCRSDRDRDRDRNDDDRFLRTLGAYAAELLKTDGGLLDMAAGSFGNGLAATLDRHMSRPIVVVPEHYRPNDWFTDRCDCSDGLSVAFPSVDAGQLMVQQLAGRPLERVRFRNPVDRRSDPTATLTAVFRHLRLLTDITVDASDWHSSRHVTNAEFAVDRVEFTVKAVARHRRHGRRTKLRYVVDVTVRGLRVNTHDQLDARTEWTIGDRLPMCVVQAVKRGVGRAIRDTVAAAKPTAPWTMAFWGFSFFNNYHF